MAWTKHYCEVCGDRFKKSYSKQRTCGIVCGQKIRRKRVRVEKPKPKLSDIRSLVYFPVCGMCAQPFTTPQGRTKYCSPTCATSAQNQRSKAWPCRLANAKPKPVATGLCECGQDLDHHLSPLCTKCRRDRRRLSDKRRALKVGVEYEPVNRRKVYERDDWTCHICGDDIDPAAAWPDQMCASLDHLLPMSLGGPHTYANTAAAHWLCNSYKGADAEFSLRVA